MSRFSFVWRICFAKNLQAARDWVLHCGLYDVPPTRRAQNMAKHEQRSGPALVRTHLDRDRSKASGVWVLETGGPQLARRRGCAVADS